MAKLGITGDPLGSYSFPIAGDRILYAPTNTALPLPTAPIYDTSLPFGWTDVGPPENGLLTVQITMNIGKIETGAIKNLRRDYIDGQSGKITGKIFGYEPQKLADLTGQSPIVTQSTVSISRSYKDLFFGGQLGSKWSILIIKDFDIVLTEDLAGGNYEQAWLYSPKVQFAGAVNLSEVVTKSPILPIDLDLFPYTNVAAGARDILIQMRYLGTT